LHHAPRRCFSPDLRALTIPIRDRAAFRLSGPIHAHDPALVQGGLNRILSSEAHGQFASAAYVCVDTENRNALYSAAGHPPLLCWRDRRGESSEQYGSYSPLRMLRLEPLDQQRRAYAQAPLQCHAGSRLSLAACAPRPCLGWFWVFRCVFRSP